jgi:hypothetical protein
LKEAADVEVVDSIEVVVDGKWRRTGSERGSFK